MSLVLNESNVCSRAELILGQQRLPICCTFTVEWLRGIPEPTWYGYFTPLVEDLAVLPGAYHLELAGGGPVQVLLWRPPAGGPAGAVPFWGMGPPPAAQRDG